jgi:uncharacterized protein (DUF2225 family)
MTEALESYYDKSITCPLCENTYKTRKIRTRFSNPSQIDSDFCPHYKDEKTNPLYYLVNVCTQCGFSFTDQFSDHLSEEAKEKIFYSISRAWKTLDFTQYRGKKQAVDSYKLAIYCAEFKLEKPEVLAGLCLRLAWIFRQSNEYVQEERFLRLALKKYEEAYIQNTSFDENMSEMKMLFIIGELHRRLGNHQDAIRNFTKVINHKNKEDDKKMVKLAREQWMEMREQKQTDQDVPENEQ